MFADLNNIFNILIVDDELYGRENLALYIVNYLKEKVKIFKASNLNEAQKILNTENIHILFLDIRLEREFGFNLLDLYPERQFATIIVSGNNQYGITALKYGVIDYVLKPYGMKELYGAIDRAINYLNKSKSNIKNDSNKQLYSYPERLKVNTLSGFYLIESNQIVRLESNSNYTKIFLHSQDNLLVAKTLKDFEPFLNPLHFFRVHRSHIVNLNFVNGYSSKDGNFLLMSDGNQVEIARSRYKEFLDIISRKFGTIL